MIVYTNRVAILFYFYNSLVIRKRHADVFTLHNDRDATETVRGCASSSMHNHGDYFTADTRAAVEHACLRIQVILGSVTPSNHNSKSLSICQWHLHLLLCKNVSILGTMFFACGVCTRDFCLSSN
mmetsp:Transcript_518/g.595  ORF Transcript_518/g.595 Transcript_518/m.595 type:complete len:125 (+) Transcript_518:395-769(+)